MKISKTGVTVVSITMLASIGILAAEAWAASPKYMCESASLQVTGEETITFGGGGGTHDVPIFSLLATGCVPDNEETPRKGKVGVADFYAKDGEMRDRSGKVVKVGRTVMGTCQAVDAGDGQGLVVGTDCTGGIYHAPPLRTSAG